MWRYIRLVKWNPKLYKPMINLTSFWLQTSNSNVKSNKFKSALYLSLCLSLSLSLLIFNNFKRTQGVSLFRAQQNSTPKDEIYISTTYLDLLSFEIIYSYIKEPTNWIEIKLILQFPKRQHQPDIEVEIC